MTPEEKRAAAVERVRQWRKNNPEKYQAQLARRDNAAYNKKWRENNPERARANQRRTREKNRAVFYERTKQWHQSHPERMRELRDRWNAANPEKKRQSDKASHERNRDSMKESRKKWYVRNKDQATIATRKWQRENREHIAALRRITYHSDIHKARLKVDKRRHLKGKHTVAQWLERVTYYGWRCRWCGKQLTAKTLTKDHVIAASKGGTNWPSNLVPACGPCNSGKCAKRHYTPPDQSKLFPVASATMSRSASSPAG